MSGDVYHVDPADEAIDERWRCEWCDRLQAAEATQHSYTADDGETVTICGDCMYAALREDGDA